MTATIFDARVEAERIVDSYGGEATSDGWIARCPCHADSKSSLSLHVSDDGKLLAHCLAGCDQAVVFRRLLSDGFRLSPKRSVSRAAAEYIYLDANSRPWGKVIRKTGKKFSQSFFHDGSWVFRKPKSWRPLPYHYPEVLEAMAHSLPIALVEGEADADALLAVGLVATTTPMGAGTWGRDSVYWSEFFAGAKVLVFYDYDSQGLSRLDAIMGTLPRVAASVKRIDLGHPCDMSTGYDVSDYLEDNGAGALSELIKAAPLWKESVDGPASSFEGEVVKPAVGGGKVGKVRMATYEEHVEFFLSLPTVEKVEKDLLTDQGVVTFSSGATAPLKNCIEYFRAYVRANPKNKSLALQYSAAAVSDYLQRFEQDDLTPKLLLDVPPWDGEDRIHKICKTFLFTNSTAEIFEDLIKGWCAGIFRRINDPSFQQPMIIINGPQGCGKDTFVSALLGGFGPYKACIRLDTLKSHEEIFKLLHTALVFTIPEFARTRNVDVNILKAIITQESTYERMPYEREAKRRLCRGSFIATSNDFYFRDSQNRRYWLFEASFMGITMKSDGHGTLQGTGVLETPYPGSWLDPKKHENQLQILAQIKHLNETNYLPAAESLERVIEEVQSISPENKELSFLHEYDAKMAIYRNLYQAEIETRWIKVRGEKKESLWLSPNHKAFDDLIKTLREQYGYRGWSIFAILAKWARRRRFAQGYLYRGHGPDSVWASEISDDGREQTQAEIFNTIARNTNKNDDEFGEWEW